jgi:hypothetical protein
MFEYVDLWGLAFNKCGINSSSRSSAEAPVRVREDERMQGRTVGQQVIRLALGLRKQTILLRLIVLALVADKHPEDLAVLLFNVDGLALAALWVLIELQVDSCTEVRKALDEQRRRAHEVGSSA